MNFYISKTYANVPVSWENYTFSRNHMLYLGLTTKIKLFAFIPEHPVFFTLSVAGIIRCKVTLTVVEKLDKWEKLAVADGLEETNFSDGDLIIKQGTKGEEFFFIVEG